MNTSNLPQIITVSDPGYYQEPKPTYWQYMVELLSNEIEDDGTGHAVPVDSLLADVIVLEPTLKAIKKVNQPYLINWEIASYWKPEEADEF